MRLKPLPTFAILKKINMKRTALILLLAAGAFTACKMDDKKSSEPIKDYTRSADSLAVTTIQWLDTTSQDLGKINEGEIIEVAYRFKNTGSKPLVIEDVAAGCGCTVPEKPEKPFAPGEDGVIKAKFNSEGRQGTQNKYVNVKANTAEQTYTLTFKVEVNPKSK